MKSVMRWIPILSAVCLAGAFACAGTPASKVVKPPAPISWQSRPQKPAPPVLIAPPPAYGNKIVMARGETTTSAN
jgi:hypothetical protein